MAISRHQAGAWRLNILPCGSLQSWKGWKPRWGPYTTLRPSAKRRSTWSEPVAISSHISDPYVSCGAMKKQEALCGSLRISNVVALVPALVSKVLYIGFKCFDLALRRLFFGTHQVVYKARGPRSSQFNILEAHLFKHPPERSHVMFLAEKFVCLKSTWESNDYPETTTMVQMPSTEKPCARTSLKGSLHWRIALWVPYQCNYYKQTANTS